MLLLALAPVISVSFNGLLVSSAGDRVEIDATAEAVDDDDDVDADVATNWRNGFVPVRLRANRDAVGGWLATVIDAPLLAVWFTCGCWWWWC